MYMYMYPFCEICGKHLWEPLQKTFQYQCQKVQNTNNAYMYLEYN